MTEGMRTPAQQSYDEYKRSVLIRESTRITWDRAEEIASDVRALAAKVDSDIEMLWKLRESVEYRLGALEYQRDRAEADADDLEQIRSRVLPQSPETLQPFTVRVTPEPVCEYCGGGGKIVHLTFDEVCGHCRPPEQEVQEPVCQNCGHAKSFHRNNGEGACLHSPDSHHGYCDCVAFVPAEQAAPEPVCELGERCDGSCQRCEDLMFERIYGGEPEQAVQEPPALDPQIEEIITQAYLYGSARCAQGIEVGAGRDSGESIKRMLKEWETLTEMIRAYDGDAREGGK